MGRKGLGWEKVLFKGAKKDMAYFLASTTLTSQANSPLQGSVHSLILICWDCPTTHKSKHRPWSERFSLPSASQSRYLRHVHSAAVACHKVRGPLAGDQVSTHTHCFDLHLSACYLNSSTHTRTPLFSGTKAFLSSKVGALVCNLVII